MDDLIIKAQKWIIQAMIDDDPVDDINALIADFMKQAERIGYAVGRSSTINTEGRDDPKL